LPRLDAVGLDARVLLFSLAILVVTGGDHRTCARCSSDA
jgi:hypothetical protein